VPRSRSLPRALAAAVALTVSVATAAAAHAAPQRPPWLIDAGVIVHGSDTTLNCRTGVCRHNENTDLIRWQRSIWLVHRTAQSQILGPNSSLRIYESTDGGASFPLQAVLPAPVDRDIRDPAFYVTADGVLHIKAIAREPGIGYRDCAGDALPLETHSADGRHWSPWYQMAPNGWSFWRPVEHGGVFYDAAYAECDWQVDLFRSTDGIHWEHGPVIYAVPRDTPLETELVFSPSGGRVLALVRTDGDPTQIGGNEGTVKTVVCWAPKPFNSFNCPQELLDVRLDGPVAWWWSGRLFVLARKQIPDPQVHKRTALYELTGNFEGGPLAIHDRGELPSAGDTSYAGIAQVDPTHYVTTWYSSDPAQDPGWEQGYAGPTDIWRGHIDMTKIPGAPPAQAVLGRKVAHRHKHRHRHHRHHSRRGRRTR
jgi:hypothetical protein